MSRIRLVLGDWLALSEAARKIRFEVFVDEQHVPAEMELDAFDVLSLHAVVFDGKEPLATGRLLPNGRIGRMAVVKAARGRGLGGSVLQALIDEGKRRGYREFVLSAQTHAIGFYAKYGFLAKGDIYPEAGIAHQEMRLNV